MAPRVAFAHPMLDEAEHLFDEAQFDEAVAAYERAEGASNLTREDLVRLYAGRALVHHTRGDSQSLELDLFRLATLEPDHRFPAHIPPLVREAFERVRAQNNVTEPVAVSVQANSAPGGVRVEGRVERDLAAIVQEVRVGMRTPGREWTVRVNAPLEMPITSDQTVEYFAEAVGPGGAVIAHTGSQVRPRSSTVDELVHPVEVIPDDDDDDDDSGGVPLWPFIVGGVTLAAAGAVLLVILLSGTSDQTDLQCCEVP